MDATFEHKLWLNDRLQGFHSYFINEILIQIEKMEQEKQELEFIADMYAKESSESR